MKTFSLGVLYNKLKAMIFEKLKLSIKKGWPFTLGILLYTAVNLFLSKNSIGSDEFQKDALNGLGRSVFVGFLIGFGSTFFRANNK
jgi:uncharacterized membrane protein YfcA